MTSQYVGRTIGLYGDSGSGKTTQAGEYAKHVFKTRGKRTILNCSDRGGYDSVMPLVRAGIIIPNELGPEDDAWMFINDASTGGDTDLAEIGCIINDSGTSHSEALLTACSHADTQIGQQRTQKFTVSAGKGASSRTLQVSINNEAHYGVVQGFMLDAIWKSTWLTRQGIDVIWTFSVLRGEEQDRTPILGPKLAGKALTPAIPKWFKYFFKLNTFPVEGEQPRHVLYIAEQPELAGLGHSFGNARYPMGATPLPATVEPASLVEAIALIERGQEEADAALAAELAG